MRYRPALLNGVDGLSGHVQRHERAQRRIAVGLGVDRVGLRLLVFTLRDTIVLHQILVEVREPAVGASGGQRLLIGADGGRKIGRIHHRQRVAFADFVTL